MVKKIQVQETVEVISADASGDYENIGIVYASAGREMSLSSIGIPN